MVVLFLFNNYLIYAHLRCLLRTNMRWRIHTSSIGNNTHIARLIFQIKLHILCKHTLSEYFRLCKGLFFYFPVLTIIRRYPDLHPARFVDAHAVTVVESHYEFLHTGFLA